MSVRLPTRKPKGARRISKVRLLKLLETLGPVGHWFTSVELAGACYQEKLKYDTVQRALRRYGFVKIAPATEADEREPDGRMRARRYRRLR